jgi:hypothetical protein
LGLSAHYYGQALAADGRAFLANYGLADVLHLQGKDAEAKAHLAVAREAITSKTGRICVDSLEGMIDRSIRTGHPSRLAGGGRTAPTQPVSVPLKP